MVILQAQPTKFQILQGFVRYPVMRYGISPPCFKVVNKVKGVGTRRSAGPVCNRHKRRTQFDKLPC